MLGDVLGQGGVEGGRHGVRDLGERAQVVRPQYLPVPVHVREVRCGRPAPRRHLSTLPYRLQGGGVAVAASMLALPRYFEQQQFSSAREPTTAASGHLWKDKSKGCRIRQNIQDTCSSPVYKRHTR